MMLDNVSICFHKYILISKCLYQIADLFILYQIIISLSSKLSKCTTSSQLVSVVSTIPHGRCSVVLSLYYLKASLLIVFYFVIYVCVTVAVCGFHTCSTGNIYCFCSPLYKHCSCIFILTILQ